jgi:hypothetical protein
MMRLAARYRPPQAGAADGEADLTE